MCTSSRLIFLNEMWLPQRIFGIEKERSTRFGFPRCDLSLSKCYTVAIKTLKESFSHQQLSLYIFSTEKLRILGYVSSHHFRVLDKHSH